MSEEIANVLRINLLIHQIVFSISCVKRRRVSFAR